MTCGNLPPTPYTIMDFRIRVGRRIQGRDLIVPAADIVGDISFFKRACMRESDQPENGG